MITGNEIQAEEIQSSDLLPAHIHQTVSRALFALAVYLFLLLFLHLFVHVIKYLICSQRSAQNSSQRTFKSSNNPTVFCFSVSPVLVVAELL